MTDIAVTKTLLSLSPAPAVAFAAMDSATQISLVNLATLIVSTVGALGAAWIAYRQAQLRKTVEVLEKNTNSMKDALVASTAKASRAEGVQAGVNQAEVKAALITASEAVGAAKEADRNKPVN